MPATARGQKLLGRGAQHVVGETVVLSPGASDRFAADDQNRRTGGRNPQGEVGGDVVQRIVDPLRLDDGGEQRQQSGGGECRGAVAAKHGAPSHLAPDGRYVGQCPMQILHAHPV